MQTGEQANESARRMFEKLTDDRHGHEDTEINNVANARAAAEAKASPGTSPTTATATFGIHFNHLGARMLAMAQCASNAMRGARIKFFIVRCSIRQNGRNPEITGTDEDGKFKSTGSSK